MKDVSVIIATHDRPTWLYEAVASIQASADVAKVKPEIIVVDDASATHDAEHVAAEFRASYVRLEENVGFSFARQVGLGMAESRYLVFWDDDDVMLAPWFMRHLEAMEEGADVVSGSYYLTDAELHNWRPKTLAPVTQQALHAGRVSANDASLIRASVMVPLRPEMQTAVALTLWLELAGAGARFATVTEPTWLYRQHGGSMHAAVHDGALRRQAIERYAATQEAST